MSLLVAFKLGLLPSLAGIRFNGDELLARLQPAPDALRPTLVALSEELGRRGRETVEMVLECERLVVELGRLPPDAPRTPAEYRAWASGVAKAGHETFGRSVTEGGAFVLGLHFGDLVLTLTLEEFVAALLRAAPDHAFLVQQAAALADGERQAREGLALVSRSVGLPDAAQRILEGADKVATASELLARRADLEAALAE